jgi:sulfite exporter TauE/SafE
LPVRSVGGAVGLGLVWGWLPCGMVYMVLVQALGSGGALSGAGLMLAFGLGPLPNLLAVGAFAGAVSRWLGNPWVRRAAGAVLVAFAVLALWAAFAGGGHGGMPGAMSG